MKEPINMSMTWAEMQERPTVGGGKAFWELTILDIIEAFAVNEWYGQYDHMRITESGGFIRLQMYNREPNPSVSHPLYEDPAPNSWDWSRTSPSPSSKE